MQLRKSYLNGGVYMDFPNIKPCLDTSEYNLSTELYIPCLKWASRYDRGVGYFTTGWMTYNMAGLSDFASRGGKMRLVTSPILSNADLDAIINEPDDQKAFARLTEALSENIDVLKKEMEKDVFNTLAWMIHDGIIDIKFAVPCNELQDGDFHDKFGIFYHGEHSLSFSGSINDSKHGFQNYESIKVFKSWSGTKEYVDSDAARFKKIWKRRDHNLKIYNIPEAIKEKVFILRTADRPYNKHKDSSNKWVHQDVAVDCFMKKGNGILAMATGTGKTITAMKIMNRLFEEGRIRRTVITMYGNDLLDQWAKQIRETYKSKQIYCHYGTHKELNSFIIHPDDTLLLISRDSKNLTKLLTMFERTPGDYKSDTLFIFDEVHGAGSNKFAENLNGKLSPYKYRLGLSATPEREYDDAGNDFLLNEIGGVLFAFSLQDAIRKGILCEFDYIPLPYILCEEEKQKKKKIIAAFNAKQKGGELFDEKDMFTQLSLVNKTAIDKIKEFERLVSQRPELLKKCIIFVQTMEYGLILQDVLQKYTNKYHTYYADDEKVNLENFAEGKIECLLTCKKVSEGIDISRVANIFLFSSDRSRLVTTQRIGRALRLDKSNPNKLANVIDFVLNELDERENNADQERKEWLVELSKTRRSENEKQNN
jgi:superfamily II DNA or RNA helicase